MNPADNAISRPGDLTIEPFHGTVTVSFSDAIIASSDRAKVLRERGHEPVFYIPFEDIYFELLQKTNASSRCPLKGTASYWRATAVGESADNAMWAYETPNPQASTIAGHGAFDPRLTRIEAVPAEDLQHTVHSVE